MAIVTDLIRAGGFWAMAYVPVTARLRTMLDALPGSIVAATVLPIVVESGPVAVVAIVTAAGIMAFTRNALLAIASGVMVAALMRGAGI